MEPFLQITTGPGGETVLAAAEERFITFLLVFVRCIALIVSMPVFNARTIPVIVKVLIALGISVVVEASIPVQEYDFSGAFDLVLLAAGELMIGLMLGFIGQILFQSVALAGEVIGQQAGFAIVTALDPSTNQDSALIAQILMLIATFVFLVANGHQVVLLALADTFRYVPPGGLAGIAALGDAARTTTLPMAGVEDAPGFFDFAMRLAAPLVVALITTTLAEAVMAKMVPQVNIMILGFAIRIVLGLFMLLLTIPMGCWLIRIHIMQYPDWARTMTTWLRAEPVT